MELCRCVAFCLNRSWTVASSNMRLRPLLAQCVLLHHEGMIPSTQTPRIVTRCMDDWRASRRGRPSACTGTCEERPAPAHQGGPPGTAEEGMRTSMCSPLGAKPRSILYGEIGKHPSNTRNAPSGEAPERRTAVELAAPSATRIPSQAPPDRKSVV